MPLEKLTRKRIQAALSRLSELAAKEGVRLEMTIYGGAAMMLAFDARESTKDIDAIVHPRSIAERLIRQVARDQKLHEAWLNDDVRQFVSTHETRHPLKIKQLEQTHLSLTRPTTKYLLAMKAMACRSPLPGYDGDAADLIFLIRKMGIRSVAEIQDITEKYFPDSPLPARSERMLKALVEKAHEAQDSEQMEPPGIGLGGR